MKTQPGYANGPIYWTIENAAAAIQKQEDWHDGPGRTLFEQMLEAAQAGELPIHHHDTEIQSSPRRLLGFADLVTPAEVNAWLRRKGSTIQWNTGCPKTDSVHAFLARPNLSALGGQMETDDFLHWLELPKGTTSVVFEDLPHLIATALWPHSTGEDVRRDMSYGGARINLEEELPREVAEQRLVVRDPLTLAPHPFPIGESLRRALVLLPDLQRFLTARSIGIRLMEGTPTTSQVNERPIEHFVLIPAVPDRVPELLRGLPLLESVRYRRQCDEMGGEGASNAKTLILDFETIIARQAIGRYSIDEAAYLLACNTGDSWRNWRQRIIDATQEKELAAYDPNCVAPRVEATRPIDSCWHEVYDDELNAWLSNKFKRVSYRFSPSVNPSGTPDKDANSEAEERRINGSRLWRLKEAVRHVTSLPGFGVSAPALEERLASRDESVSLTVRDVSNGKPRPANNLCVFLNEWLFAEDFNAWLEAAGFCEPYRLPLDASTIAEQVTPDTEAESAPSSARSLTTSHIACAFAGLGRWNEDAWKSNLGNHRKWMLCAVVNRGARGVRETTWNPVLLASALIGLKKGVKAKSIRAKFQTHHLLKPFEGEWKDHEAMFHSDD